MLIDYPIITGKASLALRLCLVYATCQLTERSSLAIASETAKDGASITGAVCFEEQNHSNGVELSVEGAFTEKLKVYWPSVTDQMLRCWNHDEGYTTEQAAYGVACLLIRHLTTYTIIHRSRKGTGFDYWLGDEESKDELPLQSKARLEVSGIRRGNDNLVQARVRKKLKQVKRSDKLALPAYIVVVEFGTPKVHVRIKQ